MNVIITKIVALFTSLFTMLTVIFCPPESVVPEFPESAERVQTAFYEGEFVMGHNDLVVSPSGDDSNPGTVDLPLKTFEKAKEILKETASDEAVTVWFREGTYYIDEKISFTADDRSNVLYRSYPKEKVEFSGSKVISSWSETKINGVNAFVTDVPVESEDDYFRSLFKGDKRLSRPNYPKEGMFKIADPAIEEAIPASSDPDFFTYSVAFYAHKDNIMNFANASDVEVKVMHFWCDEHLPIHSVDASTGRIETTKPSSMKLRVDDNFVYENVKEALLLPGEWYLDRAEQKLYYIPENGDTVENTVLQAGVNDQLFSFENAENISFQGIDFINTDWDHVDGVHTGNPFDSTHPLYKNIKYGAVHPQAAYETPAAIYISASSGINFTDCRFENISYTAMKFEKASTDCLVKSCMFNEIGANAVFIHGDFVVPASTKNIDIIDCHISKYGRIFNNAIGILLTHAIDCDLTNNEIHDGWYTGVSVGWSWGYNDNSTNNIKICDNLIYNIGNGWLSDMGAIYTLGIQPDTVISGNVIYNVGCDEGRYGYGGWGIYLDEGSSGILVEKNLVYDCSSQTFHQHYGRDNILRNNIFAFGGDGAFRITKTKGPDPSTPSNQSSTLSDNSLTLSNNIIVTDNATMYALTTEPGWFVDDGNTYWDYKYGGNVYSGDSMSFFERKSMVIMTLNGYYNNAAFVNPLFKDAENRDFTLALNSPALETGFEAWENNAGTKTLF